MSNWESGMRGDQNTSPTDLTVADELVLLDLLKEVANAAFKRRNLTREQVVQLDAFLRQITAGNPLAGMMLEFMSAVLVSFEVVSVHGPGTQGRYQRRQFGDIADVEPPRAARKGA